MTLDKDQWERTVSEVQKMMDLHSETSYVKQMCDAAGNLTGVLFFANADVEKGAFETHYGMTMEEMRIITSLTEKQRNLVILQSQKEKIEKEIEKVLASR